MIISKNDKLIITGAAGLVGQNLIMLLCEKGYRNIVALDKNEHNLKILKSFNPNIEVVLADLAEKGNWEKHFQDARAVIVLHAQITGTKTQEFIRNNLTATANVIDMIKRNQVNYIIHISSSVINSVANDNYTHTKTEQEKIIVQSGINYCILRPTLMFGWFDRKHLGWLARFMEKWPIFPIPGNGLYVRQPLYARDFCRIILAVVENLPSQQIFDIVGKEEIYYIDIIKTIKRARNLRTMIVKIPYAFFYLLLKCVSAGTKNPPFTAEQLKALTAGDYFKGVNAEEVFGIKMTHFHDAIVETFTNKKYSNVSLER